MNKLQKVPTILLPFLPKMLCKWANIIATFNAKTEQTLAENILSFSHIDEHFQWQSHCLGHQLGKVITFRNSIMYVPVRPYDHCRASFSITHHILHVSSFIHSINIDWAPTGRLAEKQGLLLNKQERKLCDSPDCISMLPWRNLETGYSLWWPLSSDEAHCARMVTSPSLLLGFSI